MKLNQVIRRYFIFGLSVVMIIGCISHFVIFKFFVHYSTDKVLYDYKKRIEEYVDKHGTFNTYPVSMVQPSRIEEKLIDNPESYPEHIKDTLIFSTTSGEFYSYRQLYFPIYYSNHWHQVNINKQIMQTDDLIMIIAIPLFILFILFLLFSLFINYFLKKNIGDFFYKNLEELTKYDLKANTELDLVNPGITELDLLNDVIMRMVGKINEDYENSRIFIEDVSHEMRTLLFIVKSKLEHFVRDNSFKSEEQIKDTEAMLQAITRLTRLTRSLTLIDKINNNQFDNKKEIDITSLTTNFLDHLKELIDMKEITLHCNLEPFTCLINPELAEILLINLLKNSIQHNVKGGTIWVECKPRYLLIQNSTTEPLNSSNLFNRFVYNHKSRESSGLGLNIVKSICDKNNFTIGYDLLETHIFQIKVTFT